MTMLNPTNRWLLVTTSPFQAIWLVLLSLGLFFVALWSVWHLYKHPQRLGLIGLRLLALSLTLALLWQPAVEIQSGHYEKAPLAIVLDRSHSMALSYHGAESRDDRLKTFLQQSQQQLQTLSEKFHLHFYDLQGQKIPLLDNHVSAVDLSKAPTTENSDLLEALEKLPTFFQQSLAAAVLISDGADTAGLLQQHSDSNDRLKKLGFAVNTIDITAGYPYQDLAIVEILSDEFAFVRNTLDIEASVVSHGYPQLETQIELHEKTSSQDLLLASQAIVLDPGKKQSIHFRIKPETVGVHVYEVRLQEQVNEVLETNNHYTFAVQVIRDKIRVLQVAGKPSADERFLREYLKTNPNTDLVSFFILRTPWSDTSVPENEMALIPFPVAKLFTTELSSFDVIIFQNFDYRPYQMEPFLSNIEQAVQNGLGLMMLGGKESFHGGGYEHTPLEKLIPMQLHQSPYQKGPIQLKLSSAGEKHPLTKLLRQAHLPKDYWQKLPPLIGMNIMQAATAPATVLAYGSFQESPTQQHPLISVMEVGKGRSMAVASDSLWRWRFHYPQDNSHEAHFAYHRFWSNALHWLVRDPEHSRLKLKTDKKRYQSQDKVSITASWLGEQQTEQSLNPGSQNDNNHQQKISFTLQKDQEIPDLLNLPYLANENQYHKELQQLAIGVYRLVGKVIEEGFESESAEAVFIVDAIGPEWMDPASRPDLLKQISQQTFGNFLNPEVTSWQKIQAKPVQFLEIDKRQIYSLWDKPLSLLLVLFFWISDFWYRRKQGFF